MCWVFDLDGVLVDSRDAVTECYRRVGVDIPDGAWGQPAGAWLPQVLGQDAARVAGVHARKNQLYPSVLHELGRALPPLESANNLARAGAPVFVLTGASHGAASVAMNFLRLNTGVRLLAAGCSTADKIDRLARLAVRYPRGTYVDDQDGVTVPNGWRMIKWTA